MCACIKRMRARSCAGVQERRTFPEAEQPADLITPLLPFQRESLTWLTQQEHGAFHGGILADEMGMGKTVQAIALILANRTDALLPDGAPPPQPPPYTSDGAIKHVVAATAAQLKSARAVVKETTRQLKAALADASSGRSASAKAAALRDPRVVAAQAAVDSAKAALEAAGAAAKKAQVEPEEVACVAPWQPLPRPVDVLQCVARPGGACKTTLVICPVVALTQWRSEILRHARPGSVSVLIYHGTCVGDCGRAARSLLRCCAHACGCRVHSRGCVCVCVCVWARWVMAAAGANRTTTMEELSRYDIVLTTYSILEAEFRKMTSPFKEACPYCAKLFMPEKLRIHWRYFCGPDAMKTQEQQKQERTRRDAPAASARSKRG
ncbi:hypothetical protein EON67_09130, partial [archaeon]